MPADWFGNTQQAAVCRQGPWCISGNIAGSMARKQVPIQCCADKYSPRFRQHRHTFSQMFAGACTDDKVIASCSGDGSIRIMDITTGKNDILRYILSAAHALIKVAVLLDIQQQCAHVAMLDHAMAAKGPGSCCCTVLLLDNTALGISNASLADTLLRFAQEQVCAACAGFLTHTASSQHKFSTIWPTSDRNALHHMPQLGCAGSIRTV